MEVTHHKEGNNNNVNNIVGCNDWTEVGYGTSVFSIRIYRDVQQPEKESILYIMSE